MLLARQGVRPLSFRCSLGAFHLLGSGRVCSSEAMLLCCLQLAMGKMMEQGPVLIVTFQAQLVMVIKNPKGEVVEGDPVSGELRDIFSQRAPWPA